MVTDYTVAPIFMNENSGSHEWLIEFEKEPDNFEYFVNELDTCLQQLNSDYEAKRFNDYILKSPVVKLLPKGSFYNWLKSNNRLGGQYKVPRLNNGREFVDSISKAAL